MRANSPRSPGCAEDASNCQPPLQQAALVFISTACKNSAWPSSALVTGRAARWERSLVETPPPGSYHRRRGADSQYGWRTSPYRGVVNTVLRIYRQHLPSSPPSPEPQRGSLLRAATTGAKLYLIEALADRVGSHFIQTTQAYVNAFCRLGWSFGFSPNEVLFSAACFMQLNSKVGEVGEGVVSKRTPPPRVWQQK